MSKTRDVLLGFLKYVVDTVFPGDAAAEQLGDMDTEKFLRQAKRWTRHTQQQNIISFFKYKDPIVRQAIWQLKYRHNEQVAKLLADALYVECKEMFRKFMQVSDQVPLLIPIPLSKRRFEERGYNQVEVLARELCKIDEQKHPEPLFVLETQALRKIKDTASQAKSASRAERLKNLSGCFWADVEKVRRRAVILLDDVMTTGATLQEAEKVLKAVGVQQIFTITLAH